MAKHRQARAKAQDEDAAPLLSGTGFTNCPLTQFSALEQYQNGKNACRTQKSASGELKNGSERSAKHVSASIFDRAGLHGSTTKWRRNGDGKQIRKSCQFHLIHFC